MLLILIIETKFLVSIGLSLFIFASIIEIYIATGIIKKIPLAICGIAFALSILIIDFANIDYMQTALIGFMMLFLLVGVIWHDTIKISDISQTILFTLYIFITMITIKYVFVMDYGTQLVYIIFMSAYLTDTGGYFIGKKFGKHKLTKISPNKTVEGVIGGYIFALASFLIYAIIMQFAYQYSVNYLNLLIYAAVLPALSVIGDLVASAIKREFDIKDFGSFMPGHGGLIDRIDSVMFVAPVTYFLLLYLPILSR